TKFIEQIYQNPVRFHRLWGEAGQGGAVVVTASRLRDSSATLRICSGRQQLEIFIPRSKGGCFARGGRCFVLNPAAPLRKEFYRGIPVDQLKSVFHSLELSRRCRQGL